MKASQDLNFEYARRHDSHRLPWSWSFGERSSWGGVGWGGALASLVAKGYTDGLPVPGVTGSKLEHPSLCGKESGSLSRPVLRVDLAVVVVDVVGLCSILDAPSLVLPPPHPFRSYQISF